MQSILLHVQDDDGLDDRIAAALVLARLFDGHISCVHATPYAEYLANDPFAAMISPIDFSTTMEWMRLDLRARVEERLRAGHTNWDWVHVDDAVSRTLIRRAPIVDIVVLSLESNRMSQTLVGSVAAAGRAPVLALPPAGFALDPAGVAAVAWDGSVEASVALRAALPLLRKAASVHLIEIEDRTVRTHSDQAARYLSQAGIDARIVRRIADSGDAGGSILKTAGEIGATLLVMGAYGHAHATEFLFGGATRAVLSNSNIPVLLAH